MVDLDQEDYEAENGGNNQLAGIMKQPREIETKLLTIVECDEIEWLHVREEALEDESGNELVLVFMERLADVSSIPIM